VIGSLSQVVDDLGLSVGGYHRAKDGLLEQPGGDPARAGQGETARRPRGSPGATSSQDQAGIGEPKLGSGEMATENHLTLRPMLSVCTKNEFGEQAVEQLTGDRDT
jgi:hypothetical protein